MTGRERELATHIQRRNRPHSRQDKNDRHKSRPHNSPQIDPPARLAHMPGSGLKLPRYHLTEDGDDVAPVEGDGCDVEYARDCYVRTESDEVDGDAEDDGGPDGVDGGLG
jgi:hypothetical protein